MSSLHAASRLAAMILGIAGSLMAPNWLLPPTLLLVIALLIRTGLDVRYILTTLRPWLLVGALVLVTHTLTTTAAAPLGHPSWTGLFRGLWALLRVVCAMSWLALYIRVTPLIDLVRGLGWWLGPFRRLGLRTEDLGLALAVMVGTVPQVLAESRRLEIVDRLRASGPALPATGAPGEFQAPPRPSALGRLWASLMRRTRIVPPVMESLARRADALTYSLKSRYAQVTLPTGRPALWQLLVLAIWLVVVIWLGTVSGDRRPW